MRIVFEPAESAVVLEDCARIVAIRLGSIGVFIAR